VFIIPGSLRVYRPPRLANVGIFCSSTAASSSLNTYPTNHMTLPIGQRKLMGRVVKTRSVGSNEDPV
jgi:hypothetical protein